MSGISQPIGYCTSSNATISQWNSFAVVPYCKRGVMISSTASAGFCSNREVHPAVPLSRFVRGEPVARRDATSDLRGGGRPGVGFASRNRKCVSQNRLDDEAIGARRQSVANAEVHVKDAELEIGNGEQRGLLVAKLCEVPD